ncbi:hypothetical protein VDGD_21275 [Verticillium dahliae]|nr:hypothetical protein VDGD_21275 [Verticillium dahliae]
MASTRLAIATAHRCCRLCRPPSQQQQLRAVTDLSTARSPATASASAPGSAPATPQLHQLASTPHMRRETGLPNRYFDPSNGVPGEGPPDPQGKPPDENRVNLGRSTPSPPPPIFSTPSSHQLAAALPAHEALTADR